MVSIDLDLKGLVGLYEMGSLSKEKLKAYLDKFTKEDLITYILDQNQQENLEEESSDLL